MDGDPHAADAIDPAPSQHLPHRLLLLLATGYGKGLFVLLLFVVALAAPTDLAERVNQGERMRVEFLLPAVAEAADDVKWVVIGAQIEPPAAKRRVRERCHAILRHRVVLPLHCALASRAGLIPGRLELHHLDHRLIRPIGQVVAGIKDFDAELDELPLDVEPVLPSAARHAVDLLHENDIEVVPLPLALQKHLQVGAVARQAAGHTRQHDAPMVCRNHLPPGGIGIEQHLLRLDTLLAIGVIALTNECDVGLSRQTINQSCMTLRIGRAVGGCGNGGGVDVIAMHDPPPSA